MNGWKQFHAEPGSRGYMTSGMMQKLIWGAGAVHVGIIAANVPLPRRLRVRERLAGVPRFLRQIFYVHWIYIVIVLGMFAALCFGFTAELAQRTREGWGILRM